MFGFSFAYFSTRLPQYRYACPSLSTKTAGSMSSHGMSVSLVMSLVTRALPRASTKGPVGLSDTATPIALPGLLASCSTGA